MAAEDIIDRVWEQLWTTTETMRRRWVSYGDRLAAFPNKARIASERLHDFLEPAALDLVEFVSTACQDPKAFSGLEVNERHNMVEMYLGTAVISVGLCLGQLAGGPGPFSAMLGAVFSTPTAVFLLLLFPCRIYLRFRKHVVDDTERRCSILVAAFTLGLLSTRVASVGALLALLPSQFFIPPAVFALLMDGQFLPDCTGQLLSNGALSNSFFLLKITGLLTIIPSAALAYILDRGFGVLVVCFGHLLLLSIHSLMSAALLKAHSLAPGIAQLLHVIGLLFIQIPTALLIA